MSDGALFDPGYNRYMTSFINEVEYMYSEINKFKNLNQKKFKFKMYYQKILDLIERNTSFYLGCLLWAVYIKSLDNVTILNNYCLNKDYNEDISLEEINYLSKFVECFGKDTKYYLNINYKFPKYKEEILEIYKEFAKLNKGFIHAKKSYNILLPNKIKTPTDKNIRKIYDTITKEVIISGDFNKLYELKDFII